TRILKPQLKVLHMNDRYSEFHWYMRDSNLIIQHSLNKDKFIIPFSNSNEKLFLVELSQVYQTEHLREILLKYPIYSSIIETLMELGVLSKEMNSKKIHSPFYINRKRFITKSTLLLPNNSPLLEGEFEFIFCGRERRYIYFGNEYSCYECYKKRILSTGYVNDIFNDNITLLRIGEIHLPEKYLLFHKNVRSKTSKLYCLPTCQRVY
ncbi:hypothetical protein, partial [Heyndrickxia sporothermodurans]